MAKIKHNPNASSLIDEGISELEPFAQIICKHLRQLILSSDKAIIEDWKWGKLLFIRDGLWILGI